MAWSRKRMLLAVLCALVAAGAMALYASGVRAEALQSREEALSSYGGEQVEVFVATRDIAAGETLSASNVSRQVWLSGLLPAGALTAQEEVFGQVVAVSLLRNEPVVAAKLGGIAAPVSVPEGFCAVSVPTDDVLAVGGAISAGSVVMVYAAGPSSVELLAEGVLVLETSTGARLEGASGGGLFGGERSRTALSWVTLALEPHRVQEIIAASRDRSLYLVLPGSGIGLEDFASDWDSGLEPSEGIGAGSSAGDEAGAGVGTSGAAGEAAAASGTAGAADGVAGRAAGVTGGAASDAAATDTTGSAAATNGARGGDLDEGRS